MPATLAPENDMLQRSAAFIEMLGNDPPSRIYALVIIALPQDLWTSRIGAPPNAELATKIRSEQREFVRGTYESISTNAFNVLSSEKLAETRHLICVAGTPDEFRELLKRDDILSIKHFPEAERLSMEKMEAMAISQIEK